jgi:predicted nucleic acid-binding protein
MSDRRFTLDTNILVYSVDRSAGVRHQKSMTIVRRAILAECWLTLQAVSEFYAVVTRKSVMPPADAARLAGYWLDVFPSVAASADAVRNALASAMGQQASYWDALLVATAAEIGCTAILTEDLDYGGVLHGVRVLNPFTDATHAQLVARLLTED